jgi:rare lipoprotein A
MLATLALAIWALSGCATLDAPPSPHGDPALASRVDRRDAGPAEVGIASWYGEFHHGLTTASGEIFDMTQLTAAHRTLPLGTRVQVTNLENGRTVRVRVNDRGPYFEGRVVDLSRAAASALDMVERGVAPVLVATVD